MKVLGKVHCLTDLVSGESSNGQPWEKQIVVVEEASTSGKPHYLAIEFMGLEKTAKTQKLEKGDMVAIEFGIRCDDYTNPNTGVSTWFTKLDGYKVDKLFKVELTDEQEGGVR